MAQSRSGAQADAGEAERQPADGARKDLLRLVTHGPQGDIVDIYTEMPWEPLCEEVAKLRVRRRPAEPEELRIAVGAEAPPRSPDEGSLVTPLVTPLVTVASVPEGLQGVARRPQRDLNAPREGVVSHRSAPSRAERRDDERSSEASPTADPAVSLGLASSRCNNVTSRLGEALEALRSLDGRRTERILLEVLRSLGEAP